MPDYFIPLDTTRYTPIHREIIARGIINKYIMSLMEENRKTYQSRYPNFNSYQTNFIVTDNMLSDLLTLYKKDRIEDKDEAEEKAYQLTEEQEKDFEKSKSLLSLQIKSLIAREIFTDNEYYQLINRENNALQKALEIINNSKEYEKLLGKS